MPLSSSGLEEALEIFGMKYSPVSMLCSMIFPPAWAYLWGFSGSNPSPDKCIAGIKA